jgi:hypothetical protein
VLAASKGERVDARTESKQRKNVIMSRRHSGQFCKLSVSESFVVERLEVWQAMSRAHVET